jgi:hypothetical protein
MAGPGDEKAAAAGRSRLRASHADRELTVDTLKVAFVQGRLTKDELDERIGQALAARTYAELDTVNADIPAGLAGAQPQRTPPRRVSNAARWGASGFITPAILAAAYVFASVRGYGGYEAMALVIAFGYFVLWLSAGVDMLWEWHCMAVPTAGMCVRCAHSAASHRAPASCTVRLGSLTLQSRCPCTGYVPPGLSPQAADLRFLPSR